MQIRLSVPSRSFILFWPHNHWKKGEKTKGWFSPSPSNFQIQFAGLLISQWFGSGWKKNGWFLFWTVKVAHELTGEKSIDRLVKMGKDIAEDIRLSCSQPQQLRQSMCNVYPLVDFIFTILITSQWMKLSNLHHKRYLLTWTKYRSNQ